MTELFVVVSIQIDVNGVVNYKLVHLKTKMRGDWSL